MSDRDDLRERVADRLEEVMGCGPGEVVEGYGAVCRSAVHNYVMWRGGCDFASGLTDAVLAVLPCGDGPLREAASWLLRLKDGPRDESYEREKPQAWDALRHALMRVAPSPVDDRPLREALRALVEEWRYKGEFGWGPWQEGYGPDPDGTVLDDCATRLRALLDETETNRG